MTCDGVGIGDNGVIVMTMVVFDGLVMMVMALMILVTMTVLVGR